MTTIVRNGVDWSAGTIAGDVLAANHQDFACRYLSLDWRALKRSEVDSFRANNIGLVIIGEYDTVDSHDHQTSAMLGGAVNGGLQADYADDLRGRLGLPEQPIYFTLDVPPGVVPWSSVAAYLKAAASKIGKHRVGLYSGYDAIEFAVNNDLCDWFWQTYSWSGTRLHPKSHLYQYDIFGNYIDGVDVDLNKAFTENYGQTQAFEPETPQPPVWVLPMHPDWFASSLSVRYPQVERWDWKGQTLIMDTIRHNALTTRNTWQYSEPSTTSGHAGPKLVPGKKVNVERLTEVAGVHGVERSWVLTGNGTWIPEDTLNIDFTIRRRKPRPIANI